MEIAIKLLKEEIERKTIFLKAETELEYIIILTKEISVLKQAINYLNKI